MTEPDRLTPREAIDELAHWPERFAFCGWWSTPVSEAIEKLVDAVDLSPCAWAWDHSLRMWVCGCDTSVRITYQHGDYSQWKFCPFCGRPVERKSA